MDTQQQQLEGQQDVWDGDSSVEPSPKELMIARLRDRQQQLSALAVAQAQQGQIHLPTAMPRVSTSVVEWLPMATPIACMAIAGMIGVMAIWSGNQPRQMEASVIAQLAQNNKILAQSRPSVICFLAIGCPSGEAQQPAQPEPQPTYAAAPAIERAIAPALQVAPTQGYDYWIAYFQQQWVAGNGATWQAFFRDNPSNCSADFARCQAFSDVIRGNNGLASVDVKADFRSPLGQTSAASVPQ